MKHWFSVSLLVLLVAGYGVEPEHVAAKVQPAPFVPQIVTVVAAPPVQLEVLPAMPIRYAGVSNAERELLVRLCVAEVFGMQPAIRVDACLSVIDTVFTRMKTGTISDGTLEGTLGWHRESDYYWQFPPWVTLGCERVPQEACRDNVPDGWAREAVELYLTGVRGSCSGYLYYNSIPGGSRDCVISDGNQYAEFHTRGFDVTEDR